MKNLNKKIIISSALSIILLSGCNSETQIIKEVVEVQKAVEIAEPKIETIARNNSSHIAVEDLSPNFISKEQINSAVSDAGSQLYEDAEDGTISGWSIFDNHPNVGNIVNIPLSDSKVISLEGDGLKNGFVLRKDNGEFFNNLDAKILQWDGKFSDDFIIYVPVILDNACECIKYLAYSTSMHEQIDDVYQILLPQAAMDGNWHTYVRDLTQDIKRFFPNNEIVSVLDFQVRGSGSLDNIELLKNSAQNPATVNNGMSLDYSVSFDMSYSLDMADASNVNIDLLTGNIQNDLNAILAGLLGATNTSTTTMSNADLQDLLAAAQQLLVLSNTLVDLSNSSEGQSQAYIDAMLRLSDDIGEMADRIGEMADRILVMGELVQGVALEMLSTIQTTQANLLTAQTNFNTMLQTLLSGTNQLAETFGTQMTAILALLTQMQSGDNSGASAMNDMISQMIATFMQMQNGGTTPSTENMSMMIQMLTMMQDVGMSGTDGMMDMMNQGMQSMMGMMEQMMAMMADPNSGMSPTTVALEMIAAAERLADKSLDILNASLQNPEASEAMLQAMVISAEFMNDMADKMLTMADKMVVMGVMAQEVAFRVLDLMETTETNLLQAQVNFNNLILGIMGQN